ncbi:phosphotransferase [Candidatus Magnetomorum sp. HK-1]|nr:phosphotransferase [Candidatus Magnetomorum sp. HK-1]
MYFFQIRFVPLDFYWNIKLINDASMESAKAEYDISSKTRYMHINTYTYFAYTEDMVRGEKTEALLNDTMANFKQLWTNQWLPEIKAHLNYWESYPLDNAELGDLLKHFEETEKRVKRLWEIHQIIGTPMILSVTLFEEMYLDLFPESGPFDVYELLSGFSNKIIESGQALWALSQKVKDIPEVEDIFRQNDLVDVIKQLKASDAAKAFITELQSYLEKYGRQSDKKLLRYPFHIESPESVIKNIQNYINQSNMNVMVDMEEAIQKREQKLSAIGEKLNAYPKPVTKTFEFLLKAAQTGHMLKEEHNFWIDSQVLFYQRQMILTLARCLVKKGLFQTENDIFYLKPEEIRQCSESFLTNTKADIDHVLLIQERKNQEKQFSSSTPPQMLGTISSTPHPP